MCQSHYELNRRSFCRINARFIVVEAHGAPAHAVTMLVRVSGTVTVSITRAFEHDAVITAAAVIVRILFYLPQYLETFNRQN
jgi:hypothetical protein